jgi:hypothetical protein
MLHLDKSDFYSFLWKNWNNVAKLQNWKWVGPYSEWHAYNLGLQRLNPNEIRHDISSR